MNFNHAGINAYFAGGLTVLAQSRECTGFRAKGERGAKWIGREGRGRGRDGGKNKQEIGSVLGVVTHAMQADSYQVSSFPLKCSP